MLFCQCEAQCDQTVAFNCRSFTYFPSSGSCRLSSDDVTSAGPGALTVREGAMFYQRAACVEREYSVCFTSHCTGSVVSIIIDNCLAWWCGVV